MSKSFDTVQKLWSYCLWCPVCLDTCRKVHVLDGPDNTFEVTDFSKENEILTVRSLHKTGKFKARPQNLGVKVEKLKYITHTINCVNNTFTVEADDPELLKMYWFFFIQSDCEKCNSSYANGTDMELNTANNTIFNIGAEREGIYLLSKKEKYHVTMAYDSNAMLVSKCFEDKDGSIIDDSKVCQLPIVNIDFSKLNKAINKIKTMLVFS
jgi:hypothetical protein